MKKNKGTTLIEVMLYIALFSILITSSFMTAFELINSNNKTDKSLTIQEEGNFVLRKIAWALGGLDPSSPPTVTGGGCSQTLSLQKINHPTNPIVFRMNSKKIEISDGGGVFIPLTTINVGVDCLQFEIIPTLTNGLYGISATTTINGVGFVVTKYIKR